MALVTRPIEILDVRQEERHFGGDVVWWLLLLVVSMPVLLLGLAQSPQIQGFLFLSIGGIAAGIAFAQVILRLPYFTNGFLRSVLIVIVASVLLTGVALIFSLSLPVPTPPPDVMYNEDWPMRQSSLLFAAVALGRPAYLETWARLPADSSVEEVIRNFFIRQPLLWFD